VSIDALIVDLIEFDRQATDDEIAQITTHIVGAPFALRMIRPPRWFCNELARRGIELPAQISAGEFHLLRRVFLDEQWPPGTTLEDYVSDLWQAVQHPEAQIWTYHYYRMPAIGFVAPSHIPGTSVFTPFIFVAYSPQYSTIITGYQTGGSENIFNSAAYQDVRRHR
jgi:hypothetical protein